MQATIVNHEEVDNYRFFDRNGKEVKSVYDFNGTQGWVRVVVNIFSALDTPSLAKRRNGMMFIPLPTGGSLGLRKINGKFFPVEWTPLHAEVYSDKKRTLDYYRRRKENAEARAKMEATGRVVNKYSAPVKKAMQGMYLAKDKGLYETKSKGLYEPKTPILECGDKYTYKGKGNGMYDPSLYKTHLKGLSAMGLHVDDAKIPKSIAQEDIEKQIDEKILAELDEYVLAGSDFATTTNASTKASSSWDWGSTYTSVNQLIMDNDTLKKYVDLAGTTNSITAMTYPSMTDYQKKAIDAYLMSKSINDLSGMVKK